MRDLHHDGVEDLATRGPIAFEAVALAVRRSDALFKRDRLGLGRWSGSWSNSRRGRDSGNRRRFDQFFELATHGRGVHLGGRDGVHRFGQWLQIVHVHYCFDLGSGNATDHLLYADEQHRARDQQDRGGAMSAVSEHGHLISVLTLDVIEVGPQKRPLDGERALLMDQPR